MERVLGAFRRVLIAVGGVERALLLLLLANIVLNIGAQVVSRYLFNKPLVWVEEIATYSFIWSVFLGASLGLKYDRHVRIETFVGLLGPRPAALARALVFVLILALLLVLIRPIWTNIALELRRTTIALPVDLPVAWFFSVPLLVGVASMGLTAAYRLLDELRTAVSGRRMPPLFAPPPVEEDADTERVLAGEAP